MLVLFVFFLSNGWAAPTTDTAPDGAEAAEGSAEDGLERAREAPFPVVLDEAKRAYFRGNVNEALQLFVILERRAHSEEMVAPDDRAEALIYLGEIRFGQGDRETAWNVFETLLTEDPEYPINPYQHPTDVVEWFERVRTDVQRRIDEAPPPPEPVALPNWAYAPFGVPQLGQGEHVKGAAYGVLQAGFAAGSIGMLVHLHAQNRQLAELDDISRGEWERRQYELNVQRYAIQWPLTLAFYATWWASHADARRQLEAPPVVIEPTPDGATMRFQGHF